MLSWALACAVDSSFTDAQQETEQKKKNLVHQTIRYNFMGDNFLTFVQRTLIMFVNFKSLTKKIILYDINKPRACMMWELCLFCFAV